MATLQEQMDKMGKDLDAAVKEASELKESLKQPGVVDNLTKAERFRLLEMADGNVKGLRKELNTLLKLLLQQEKAAAAQARPPPTTGWLSSWLVAKDTMEQVFQRVLRVDKTTLPSSKPETVGTATLYGDNGVLLLARHSIFNSDVDMPGGLIDTTRFTANERPFRHIASFPKHNLSICQLCDKSNTDMGFRLAHPAHGVLLVGCPIRLLGFPKARDTDLVGLSAMEDVPSVPSVSDGRISTLTQTFALGVGTYGSQPNESGGAVTIDSRCLAGVHVCTLFHLDDSLKAFVDAPAEEDIMERTSWGAGPGPDGGHGNIKKRKGKTPETEEAPADINLARHCENYIPHKGARGLFIPAPMLSQLLERVV